MSKSDQIKQVSDRLTELVRDLYRLGDGRDGSPEWELHRARVRGFQEAARMLGLLTAEDVQAIIDAAHLEILGESRLDRRERLDGLDAKVARGDWDDFEGPAYQRYGESERQ